jgi:hypothetical protein
MDKGPVPSLAYDIVKALRGEGSLVSLQYQFTPLFRLCNKHTVQALAEPDLDYLSQSEMDCIDEAIAENDALSFDHRTDKSHDEAWMNTAMNRPMKVVDIAHAAGASQGMIDYIQESLENEKAVIA